MLEEWMKSFKASMYERMGSPFLSSLVVFFVYFNWKGVLIILMGENPIVERIQVIEEHHVDVNINLYYPAISSLLFSIIYPYVSLIFFAIQNCCFLKEENKGVY